MPGRSCSVQLRVANIGRPNAIACKTLSLLPTYLAEHKLCPSATRNLQITCLVREEGPSVPRPARDSSAPTPTYCCCSCKSPAAVGCRVLPCQAQQRPSSGPQPPILQRTSPNACPQPLPLHSLAAVGHKVLFSQSQQCAIGPIHPHLQRAAAAASAAVGSVDP